MNIYCTVIVCECLSSGEWSQLLLYLILIFIATSVNAYS